MKDKIDQNPRQIELFEKYYNIDKENKIIGITMHYEKASDILNINLGNLIFSNIKPPNIPSVKIINKLKNIFPITSK